MSFPGRFRAAYPSCVVIQYLVAAATRRGSGPEPRRSRVCHPEVRGRGCFTTLPLAMYREVHRGSRQNVLCGRLTPSSRALTHACSRVTGRGSRQESSPPEHGAHAFVMSPEYFYLRAQDDPCIAQSGYGGPIVLTAGRQTGSWVDLLTLPDLEDFASGARARVL